MTEGRKPIDTALDLFVFVPVGLALTAAEEVPKLAAKGRTRLTTQFRMARVVGEFAVGRARHELETRLGPPAPKTTVPPAGETFREDRVTYEEMLGDDRPPSTNGTAAADIRVATAGDLPEPAGGAVAAPPAPTAEPVPSADRLAIPGYDSLSASQVVQRLAGLSGEDLQLVQAYEAAHRARRTILNRINQLQGS